MSRGRTLARTSATGYRRVASALPVPHPADKVWGGFLVFRNNPSQINDFFDPGLLLLQWVPGLPIYIEFFKILAPSE